MCCGAPSRCVQVPRAHSPLSAPSFQELDAPARAALLATHRPDLARAPPLHSGGWRHFSFAFGRGSTASLEGMVSVEAAYPTRAPRLSLWSTARSDTASGVANDTLRQRSDADALRQVDEA